MTVKSVICGEPPQLGTDGLPVPVKAIVNGVEMKGEATFSCDGTTTVHFPLEELARASHLTSPSERSL